MNDTDAKKLNSTDEGEVITDPELLIEEESEEPADEHEAEPTTIVVSTPVVLPPSASDAAATPAPHPDAADPENRHPGGGVLVLQWLTYAFWFWFSISLSWLAGVVINFYITGGSNGYGYNEALAYPLASVLTLLVIALVTDKLYTKHEPARKTGAANVIMLLHVVPFILVGIGSLVVAIFSLISMVLNNDSAYSSDGPIQAMLVAFVLLTLLTAAAARAFYGNRSRVRPSSSSDASSCRRASHASEPHWCTCARRR